MSGYEEYKEFANNHKAGRFVGKFDISPKHISDYKKVSRRFSRYHYFNPDIAFHLPDHFFRGSMMDIII